MQTVRCPLYLLSLVRCSLRRLDSFAGLGDQGKNGYQKCCLMLFCWQVAKPTWEQLSKINSSGSWQSELQFDHFSVSRCAYEAASCRSASAYMNSAYQYSISYSIGSPTPFWVITFPIFLARCWYLSEARMTEIYCPTYCLQYMTLTWLELLPCTRVLIECKCLYWSWAVL